MKPTSSLGMQGAADCCEGKGGRQKDDQGMVPSRVQPRGVPIPPGHKWLPPHTLMAFQATPRVETLTHVYLFSQPLLTSSHTQPHLHTKPQSDLENYKKNEKPSPNPILKCQVFQFWEKRKLKKAWLMTGLTNSYLEVCWWVTSWRSAFMLWKGTSTEGASWDQPVKFHYSLKLTWR